MLLAVVQIGTLGILAYQSKRLKETVQATNKIASATVNLEGPKVFSDTAGFHPYQRITDGQATFGLQNYGRSPAYATSGCIEYYVGTGLPPTPAYKAVHRAPYGSRIIMPTNYSNPNLSRFPVTGDIDPTPDEIHALEKSAARLWLYGFVTYVDFNGDSHEARFCTEWDRANNRFFYPLDAPPAYTHST